MSINKKKQVKQSSSINPYIKYGSILIVVILVAVLIYFIVKITTKKNNSIATSTTTSATPTSSTSTTTTTSAKTTIPTTTTHPLKTINPTGKINGAWAGTIGCGDGLFNLISLASALPQDFEDTSLDNFLGKVMGNYNNNLSNGKTKYIISIGGSAASADGWIKFFKLLTQNNGNLVSKFVTGLKCRGIVGIDLDLEQTTEDMIPSIISIVNNIKVIDSNFIVMYTILLGMPTTFGKLLDTSNYDYLSLMLYNGGMYIANGSGAGCDWDGWAELILSKGTAGCKTPLGPEYLDTYIKDANLGKVDPSKVLLGLIIDTDKLKLDSSIMTRANELINKYGGCGTMIWVIPGWVNHNSISDLKALGFNIDESKCKGSSDVPTSCPIPPRIPCSVGDTRKCVATPCGKIVQNITDDNCATCKDVTWWPCGSLNFCEIDDGNIPTTTKYTCPY